MLGRYDDFPSITHGRAQITHEIPLDKLQRVVIWSLHKLNGRREASQISVADHPGTHQGEYSFQIGVADGSFFDYLNGREVKKLYDVLRSDKVFPALDFLIIVTYHYFREGRRVPLRFDRHLLRFIFYGNQMELLLFHMRGIRRMPLDELLGRVINKISQEVKRRRLKALRVGRVRTL